MSHIHAQRRAMYRRNAATITADRFDPSPCALTIAASQTSSGTRTVRTFVATSGRDRDREALVLPDDRVVREVHGAVRHLRAVSVTRVDVQLRCGFGADVRGERERRTHLDSVDLARGAVAGDTDRVGRVRHARNTSRCIYICQYRSAA